MYPDKFFGQAAFYFDEDRYREHRIRDNFKSLTAHSSLANEKIYFNFGYAHVLQEDFYRRPYLAKLIEQTAPGDQVWACLGVMAETTVLWSWKYKLTDGYKGYSVNWFGGEGDSFKEGLMGTRQLKRVTKRKETALFGLHQSKFTVAAKIKFRLYKTAI